jgi:hypothetical protein
MADKQTAATLPSNTIPASGTIGTYGKAAASSAMSKAGTCAADENRPAAVGRALKGSFPRAAFRGSKRRAIVRGDWNGRPRLAWDDRIVWDRPYVEPVGIGYALARRWRLAYGS